MRILIIRHGDPDYENDCLTTAGQKEAELLSDRLCKENITKVYCSPLGRAKLTAKPTLDKLGITAEYCDFLREFSYSAIKLPYMREYDACWDILPEYVNKFPELYIKDKWKNVEFIKESNVANDYDEVCAQFDKVLANHGYVRNGVVYDAVRPNHDTLVFVCHYGLTSVLLSHLINCSPYSIWQNCATLTTSVTTVYTEERREGIASMRCCGIGDVSHLYAADTPPSFSARFCECFTDDTRHD